MSKLIFRINVNLRRVRIFLRAEFTDILTIVSAEDFNIPEQYQHFQTAKEIKDFYIDYYSQARKCKSVEGLKQPGVISSLGSSSAFLQNEPKKLVKRAEDEEYHEEEGEE